MPKLLLVRHGQSEYNLKNIFTGWLDVALTAAGEKEAERVGELLKKTNFKPQVAFTSDLIRAQKTLDIILNILDLTKIQVLKNKALNERHYGSLQGKNKKETADIFGEDQVHRWRRSFDEAPPEGESLKDTAARTIPYFDEFILAEIKKDKDILVVAHGNSLRSIIMHVENMSPEQILKTELGTGEVFAYDVRLEGPSKKPIYTRYKI